MTFITKRAMPRRTFLRGMGVTLALPLLDSMIPAGTALAQTAASPKSRFCGIYVPHGATMDKWTPAAARTPTVPLPMKTNPQVVFERLFGDGTTAAQRLLRKQQDKSILDSITDKLGRLQGGLDGDDRARLNEYVENVREIERRIQKATQQSATNADVPQAPVGVPDSFEEH